MGTFKIQPIETPQDAVEKLEFFITVDNRQIKFISSVHLGKSKKHENMFCLVFNLWVCHEDGQYFRFVKETKGIRYFKTGEKYRKEENGSTSEYFSLEEIVKPDMHLNSMSSMSCMRNITRVAKKIMGPKGVNQAINEIIVFSRKLSEILVMSN